MLALVYKRAVQIDSTSCLLGSQFFQNKYNGLVLRAMMATFIGGLLDKVGIASLTATAWAMAIIFASNKFAKANQ